MCFWFGFAVHAPRACHSFATAQKTNEKRPPRSYAPVKSTGVPDETAQLSCCERTRKQRSDSFHRKPMTTAQFQRLAEVGLKSKDKAKI